MPDLENLYWKLPVTLQHVACSVAGWHTARRRFGGSFERLLTEAEARAALTDEQIAEFRDARLRSFVRHCYESVPFYRRRFEVAGIDPAQIRGLSDMERLPLLTKDELKRHLGELRPTDPPSGGSVAVHTSGTTGGGLRFDSSMEAVREQWATWWRYRHWHGIRRDTPCGHFAGRSIVPPAQKGPPYWRYNRPGKQILFSGYHMGPASLAAYVRELRRRRPPWLHGYPSLLALLAAHLVESGDDLGYQLRWVTTGAENLLTQQAELMTKAFGVAPVQHYGMAEAVANISQCERGALHVDEDFAAVEFVRCEADTYSVVGTNFTNPLTPLLRYEVEDLVTLEPGATCSCGRPGRVVARIDGRLEDYVVSKDGTRIGRLDHIFKDLVNVREAQIHQTRPGEITLRVVRMPGYGSADEESVMRETRSRVGNTDVKLEYVDRLERSAIGKLRFVVSELPEGAIERPVA